MTTEIKDGADSGAGDKAGNDLASLETREDIIKKLSAELGEDVGEMFQNTVAISLTDVVGPAAPAAIGNRIRELESDLDNPKLTSERKAAARLMLSVLKEREKELKN